MTCACSETAQEMATMDAEGLDVGTQNDVILESVLGIATEYYKYYDYSHCMRGLAVAMTPEQVWQLHPIHESAFQFAIL